MWTTFRSKSELDAQFKEQVQPQGQAHSEPLLEERP